MDAKEIRFKKKLSNADFELHKIIFAVYPVHLQYLSNLSGTICLYFERQAQSIGKLEGCLLGEARGKLQLAKTVNLINFRLYSFNNRIYQWSTYRTLNDMNLQYIQTIAFDILHFLPQYHHNFAYKQIALQFPKTEVKIVFLLFAADSIQTIQQYLQKKFMHFTSPNIHKISSNSIINNQILKANDKQQIRLDLGDEGQLWLKKETDVVNIKSVERKELDLDEIILNAQKDKSKASIREKNAQDEFQYIIKQIGIRKALPKRKQEEDNTQKTQNSNQLKVKRNYGILKIQSNQNYEEDALSQQHHSHAFKELIPIVRSRLQNSRIIEKSPKSQDQNTEKQLAQEPQQNERQPLKGLQDQRTSGWQRDVKGTVNEKDKNTERENSKHGADSFAILKKDHIQKEHNEGKKNEDNDANQMDKGEEKGKNEQDNKYLMESDDKEGNTNNNKDVIRGQTSIRIAKHSPTMQPARVTTSSLLKWLPLIIIVMIVMIVWLGLKQSKTKRYNRHSK